MFTALDDLAVFNAIVETGSLSGAARQLAIPKSKVSRRLASLEQHLSCQLLIRTTRRMTLTDIGQQLFEQANHSLAHLQSLDQAVATWLHNPQGKLACLFPVELFNPLLSAIIVEFAARYPAIELTCSQYVGTPPQDLSQYDLAFVLHEQPLTQLDWIARSLISFPQSLYGSAKLNRSIETLSQLATMPAITGDEVLWYFRYNDQIVSLQPKSVLHLTSPEMRLHSALRGIGITKLPDFINQTMAPARRLEPISCSFKPLALTLSVLFQSRELPAKSRAFIDYFQNQVGRFSWLG